MKFRLPLFTLATACNIFLSACATLPAHANASINPSWKWRGFEVIGNHQVPKSDIQALIPIRDDDPYEENSDLWKQWCSDIKAKFKFASTNCTSSEMHGYVQQLIRTVPAYRTNLFDVLANDQDINKREKAANLLNWTMENLADSIARSNQLLNDPSSLVRNNFSRFTLHFTDKLLNETQRLQVIDNLLIQLDRPSFADRNKSIYNLLLIAQKFASDRSYMGAKGESLIRYISQASVLPNVKEPALELLKLIEGTRDSISEPINRRFHTPSLSVMKRGAKW